MMASWDVAGLLPPFQRAGLCLHQIVGTQDRAVPPEHAAEFSRRYKGVSAELLSGLGHLAHEEDPAQIAKAIFAALDTADASLRRAAT
jgi:magnesium chelatase accessory protein